MSHRILAAATIGTVGWSLWIRRHTWYNNEFQIGATAMVAFGGAALVLMAPATTATLGVALHHVGGRYGLNLYMAHMFGVAACAAALYNAVVRLNTDEAFARKYAVHVMYPSRLIAVALLALFWESSTMRSYRSSLVDMHVDAWLRWYWIVLCGFYVYLLGYAARAFLTMRHDPDSRTVARIYLAAALSGMGACIDRCVLAVNPALGFDGHPLLVVPALFCMGAFALGAGYSWRQQQRRSADQGRGPSLVPDQC